MNILNILCLIIEKNLYYNFMYILLRRIRKNINRFGVIATIQKVIQKAFGLGDVKEEISALQFFLNAYHDASSLPPSADPDLRIMQLCDVQFLRIITKMCDRLGIKY